MDKRDVQLGSMLYTVHKAFMLGAGLTDDEFDEYSATRLLDRLDELNGLAHECAGPRATSTLILDVFIEMVPAIIAEESELRGEVSVRYGSAMAMAYVELTEHGS